MADQNLSIVNNLSFVNNRAEMSLLADLEILDWMVTWLGMYSIYYSVFLYSLTLLESLQEVGDRGMRQNRWKS
jgi:hypothetical protein